MHNYILTGMQYGDEGKGAFVDWLTDTEKVDSIVRYNGGCHASHTVISPDGILHKYSQLGSGMFRNTCHTYLTENMIVDLDALMYEIEVFSKETGISSSDILQRVHIHENCYVVTPYHKLMNMIREFSLGEERRGTVGTGVSEVKKILLETSGSLGIQVKEIFSLNGLDIVKRKFKSLQEYVFDFYKKNYSVIWANVPDDMVSKTKKWIVCLNGDFAANFEATSYVNRFTCEEKNNLYSMGCIYSDNATISNAYEKVIYEGAQGLLIDYEYGTKPNTTFLDTTIDFASKSVNPQDVTSRIGVAKAFCSRHGAGAFPTEVKSMSKKISDENQEVSYWNGKIRFGWFDAVLFRYAQSINKVDEIYLSSLDLLSNFEHLKICNSYLYRGKTDSDFEEIFEYHISMNGGVIITNIKMPNSNLGKYLEKCVPRYIILNGWNSDISNVTKKENLPDACLMYIKMIEITTSLKVSAVSVGPTRESKIRM